jgi:hypothetical protein
LGVTLFVPGSDCASYEIATNTGTEYQNEILYVVAQREPVLNGLIGEMPL